jgi:hypothetical protein
MHGMADEETEPYNAWLDPSTRVLWRSTDTIQLELGRRAVVVEGVTPATVRHLIGRAEPGPADDPGPGSGPDLELAVAALSAAGFMCTGPRRSPRTVPARLAGDLAAARSRHGRAADGIVLARGQAQVTIHGDNRLAGALGTLLAAAGVGRVAFEERGAAFLRSAQPGGLLPTDEGRPFHEAAADAARRAAPEVETPPPGRGDRPDLTVISTDGPVEEELRDRLHRQGRAHLVVQTGGEHLVVGPLVLPGLTSCLRCADLHRSDRDPAWSALAAQLATPPRYGTPSDTALTALSAGVAGLQALSFLDGDEPATLNCTLELELPHWQIRRRSWTARRDCPCGTAGMARTAASQERGERIQ